MATKIKTRQTAEERREAIADIAYEEFALRGLHGTPTSDIAKKAGISHAYLFRLFPTKTDLFIAASHRCFQRTYETFRKAAEGKEGPEALEAMGHAYIELLNDRTALLAQMHNFTACEDPEQASGADPDTVRIFFATGMLLNVIAAMNLPELDEPWVHRLLPPKLAEKP
jgi:AcrR family transcriptional regulator